MFTQDNQMEAPLSTVKAKKKVTLKGKRPAEADLYIFFNE